MLKKNVIVEIDLWDLLEYFLRPKSSSVPKFADIFVDSLLRPFLKEQSFYLWWWIKYNKT